MLLLALQAVACALEHIHLQLHLHILFLVVLRLVSQQIKIVLNLLSANIVFLELTTLDGKLTPGRVQFFSLLRYFSFILCLGSLQACDLIVSLHELFVEHLDLLLRVCQVCEHALVAGLEVSMGRMHIIEL